MVDFEKILKMRQKYDCMANEVLNRIIIDHVWPYLDENDLAIVPKQAQGGNISFFPPLPKPDATALSPDTIRRSRA